jgi:hypothetical protein
MMAVPQTTVPGDIVAILVLPVGGLRRTVVEKILGS